MPKSDMRVALVNLGCRVNRVETDIIAIGLQECGCVLSNKEDARVVVVNTCAVTGEAQAKTRKAIRSAAGLPGKPTVIATGCVASLFADELRTLGPNIVVEPRKGQVVRRVMDELGQGAADAHKSGVLAMTPTPTGRTRPGIKIQDGCNNRCTYCIVWKARGPSRSVSAEHVVQAIREAGARGAREVVLTGINLGSYRSPDSNGIALGSKLPELLSFALEQTDMERIRISSIEPPDVTRELLQVMSSSGGRIAPFLHVCLQSGCNSTLRRMGRVYTTEQFSSMVGMAREVLPRIALETDVIVGFPGESDEEFCASLDFCKEMRFSRMHVFRYSKRPGTPAAEMPDQIPASVMAERGAMMRDLANAMRSEQMNLLVGTEDFVVVQSAGKAVSGGLYDVQVDPKIPVGSMVRVRFASASDRVLSGVVVND